MKRIFLVAVTVVALACLALSLQAAGATESQGAIKLKSQLQTLKVRIRQQAAKTEFGLTAAQIAGLEGRIKSSAPEINSIMHGIQALAKQMKATLGPGSGNMTPITRSNMSALLDESANYLLSLSMQLNQDDNPKQKNDLSVALALIARMNELVGHIYDPSDLTARETHSPADLVLDWLTYTNDGRISIKMYNQGAPIPAVAFNASYVKVTVNDTIERSIYFTDIDPNGSLRIGEIPTGSGINRILMEYIWPGTGPKGIKLDTGHTYKVKVVLDFNVRINEIDRSNNVMTVHLSMPHR